MSFPQKQFLAVICPKCSKKYAQYYFAADTPQRKKEPSTTLPWKNLCLLSIQKVAQIYLYGRFFRASNKVKQLPSNCALLQLF